MISKHSGILFYNIKKGAEAPFSVVLICSLRLLMSFYFSFILSLFFINIYSKVIVLGDSSNTPKHIHSLYLNLFS